MLKEKRSSQKIPRFSEKAIPNSKETDILFAEGAIFPTETERRCERRRADNAPSEARMTRETVFFRFFSENELIFRPFHGMISGSRNDFTPTEKDSRHVL